DLMGFRPDERLRVRGYAPSPSPRVREYAHPGTTARDATWGLGRPRPGMSSMPSLATLLLWGPLALGAASIPIVLHFFYRSRFRVVPWAAMEFLLTSIQQTSRRLKFQEILLLAARVSLMLLLALTMMRPSCSSLSSPGRGEAVDAVLVFDNSYTMA